ncbi:TPA: hypothetical protein MCM29_005134 [Klebsiella pneumoniae]|nr:hypothetical protein vBKpMFBKp34_082 [Klebsiella phage vB_KpM_FBKp34]HBT0444765.1 hypothetical protein [Klebsiella pneumoniae]HBT8980395.1 hypothetical protein [Klebsiella pneumoniae]
MSIVSKETLDYIKKKRSDALAGTYYENKYHNAMRGLDSAIAILEQIEHTTQGLSIETKITLSKD